MGYFFPSSSGAVQAPADYFIKVVGSNYIAINKAGSTVASGSVFSTVINAVIALCTTASKIFISKGSYALTTSIVDGGINDLELELAQGAIITLSAGADTHMIHLTSCSNWWIHGGELNGNEANQTTRGGAANTNSYGIYLYKTNNIKITNMYIHECCRAGIKTEGDVTTQCTATLIHSCNISDCNWSGVLPDTYTYGISIVNCLFTGDGEGGVGGGTVDPIKDILVDGCTCHDMDGTYAPVGYEAGIYIEAGQYVKIVNNHCYNCMVGIFVTADGEYANVIANNTVHDCTGGTEGTGIICKSYRTIIANNNINHAGSFKPGILAGSGSDHFGSEDLIIGNIIIGSTNSHGIQLARSDNAMIANNVILGGTGKGIMLTTNSSNNNVTGNRISNSATGIEIDNANCVRNFVSDNNMDGCTDAMTDTGTNTRYGYNLNQAGTVVEGSMP